MKYVQVFMLCAASWAVQAQTIPSAEDQIKMAVLAAPAELRDGAMVYGYDAKGELTVLRKGTNALICLGDDPKQNGVNVAAYQVDLEPFMARGRKLKAEGKTTKEIFDIREEEVKAGKLKMPSSPSTLYVYVADAYDLATGTVTNGYLRYVVYIPYATGASTGLSERPTMEGQPWIMDPGTHRAHIMISPPRPKKEG